MMAADYLESQAVERATVGWLEPVFFQGKQCGTVRRYDGGLLMFLLRGMMPEKYGNKVRIQAPGVAAPVQPKVEVVFVKPNPPAEDDITPMRPADATAPALSNGRERSKIVVLPPAPPPSKCVWT
jgi:hypothetical protein